MFCNSCLLESTESARQVPQLIKIWTSLLVVLVAGGFFSVTAHFVLLHPIPTSAPAPPQGSFHWESWFGHHSLVKLSWRGWINPKLQIQLLVLSVWCSLILDWGRFCSLNQGHTTTAKPAWISPHSPSAENILKAHGKGLPLLELNWEKCIFIPCKFH